MKTKEDVLNYRIKHPNCMYCNYLTQDRYVLYYCKEKQKAFLFGNKIRAKHCPNYSPRTTDLELALETLKRLEEL